MGIVTTNKSIVFINQSNGPVTSSGFSYTVRPDAVIGILQAEPTSKAISLTIPASSSGAEYDSTPLYITQSGNNTRVGLGTKGPLGSLDVRSDSSDSPADITLRTNEDGVITVGEETGRIRFLVESSSFGIDNITTAISGASAEIFSKVNEVTATGVKGSLVFALSKTTTTASINAFEIGHNAGSTFLSTGDIHAVLSGSMELNADTPRLLLHKQDGTQPVALIGSVDNNDFNHGAIILKDSAENDDGYFVIRKDANSFLSGSGNLGIGLTSPTAKLHVDGNITSTNAVSGLTIVAQGGAAGTNGLIVSNDSFLVGNITASANLSASGEVIVNNLTVEGTTTLNGSTVTGNITASGDISSSGTVTAQNIIVGYAGSIFAKDQSGNTDDSLILNFADTGLIFGDADMSSEIDATLITLDASNKIVLDADGGEIDFRDGGSTSISFNTTDGHITASGNISASGNLFADVPESSNTSFKTVVYDTSTGKFHRTGSYSVGGGGGASSQGTSGAIQRSDGSGGFTGVFDDLYWNDTFRYLVVGRESPQRGLWFGRQLQADYITVNTLSSQLLSNNIVTWGEGLVFSKSSGFSSNYANFDGNMGHFMLFPPHQIGNTSAQNTQAYMMGQGSPGELIGSARFHVVDDNQKGHAAKIINLDDTLGAVTPAGLLLGTKRGPTFGNQLTQAFPFLDFQVACSVHGGTSIGGVYYDVFGTQFGGNANSVTYVGQFVQGSDKKLKKDITNTEKGIKDIMSMKVKDYKWKDNPSESPKATGLIAQELQETHPELVSNLNDTLNVNYTNIVPILIKAVQDQQKQINDLKNQLKKK